ncbi:S41 family peptidase [Pedobacter caeni]|nr:S41 family peptidase [Pedobacter caeni]
MNLETKHVRPFLLAVLLFIPAMLLPFCVFPQLKKEAKAPDSAGIRRIADFARVWGVIHYFHPNMGKGKLNADSLMIANIGDLLADPSAQNLKKSLATMLSDLKDPYSKLLNDPDPKSAAQKNTSTQYPAEALGNYQLAKKELYLAVPQELFLKQRVPDSIIGKHKAIRSFVIDLRNNSLNADLGLKQYIRFVQPLIASLINSTLIFPTSRSFYYKGLMRQDYPHDLSIRSPDEKGFIKDQLQVHNGFRNISEGAYLLPAKSVSLPEQARFCFLVNRNVNINTLRSLMALRNRNLCRLIFVGELPEYLHGDSFPMQLSDGLSLQIRTSEMIYEDGTLGTFPDLILKDDPETLLKSDLQRTAFKLLHTPLKNTAEKTIENTVYIRKPQYSYPSATVPDARLRLLGLFNFWNSIYYFSPNKHLIPTSWDLSLTYFIPKFLEADSDSSYFMALMELTASIKDGHSILIKNKIGRTPAGIFDGNLPLLSNSLNGKTYLTAILPDSLQQNALAQLRTGDEVLAIDHIPVAQHSKEWSRFIVASNEAGFNREYDATWFAAGSAGTEAVITTRRNGIDQQTSLKRIKRDDYYNLRGKLVRTPAVPELYPPFCKILPGNIGYLRMNRIYSKELDSISNLLKNCKSIIVDARGYPKDGKIGTALAGYIATKPDTVAYNVFPFVISPDLSKNATIIDYEIIKPNPNQNLKHKKYYVLVDEGNQSQGEWNIIALQGVTKATTIGCTTAGANGMAVTINFPGDYFSFFSGFGEFYPDHTPNQKSGVKIDIPVKRTLEGLISGRDEVMGKALEILKDQR